MQSGRWRTEALVILSHAGCWPPSCPPSPQTPRLVLPQRKRAAVGLAWLERVVVVVAASNVIAKIFRTLRVRGKAECTDK